MPADTRPDAKAGSPATPQRRAPTRRGRLVRRRRTPPGAPPGTLIQDAAAPAPHIHLIAYGPDQIEERDVATVEELRPLVRRAAVTWVDVQGLGDVETIRGLGDLFGLHGLALEDVVNVHQRPKVDDYAEHLFIVTRMPAGGERMDTEQVALFLGPDFVLTFQEHPGDRFDPVRQRLRGSPGGRIRSSGADYLAYALLDATIDAFFPVLEYYGELVEHLETEVVERPQRAAVARVHILKRDLLGLRRAIWPQREMLNALMRQDTRLLSEPTKVYLRDCYDHAIQLLDILETYREIASGLVDVYLSSVSAQMNEVMKVLTIIATVFIPLGFVAGVYGMNFNPEVSPWNMPELNWRWGYPFALGLMGAMAAGLLAYFRAKGWLGAPREAGEAEPGRPPA